LVAAAKQISTWDFKEVIQWAGRKGIEWTLVPTGGQHFNGQAERMIGLIKKQLWRSFEGKKVSHEETLTLLAEPGQKNQQSTNHAESKIRRRATVRPRFDAGKGQARAS
jgi:hypothetical protein